MNHGSECLVQKVMVSAEEKMEDFLKKQKLSEIAKKMTVVL
jgi:DNA-binding IscR family transcriptional regulator